MASSPIFSDELLLTLFEHFTDMDLLSLAIVSKHIHDVALMAYLGRYGITDANIQANSFQTTGGAVCALCVARFITRIDSLRVQFVRKNFERDVAAFSSLVQRRRIKFVEIEFPPLKRRGIQDHIESLTLDAISLYRSRPAITVSPLTVSVVRPRKASPVRRLVARLRLLRAVHEPTVHQEQFDDIFTIFSLFRLAGVIPRVSIHTFNSPAPIGSLIVLFPQRISNLRFPLDLRLSPSEMGELLTHLTLPCLYNIDMLSSIVPETALRTFLCRHSTLQSLRLLGCLTEEQLGSPPTPLLPSHTLPQLEHIFGSTRLVALILQSSQQFPKLIVATVELPGTRSTRPKESYHSAVRGLARRPTLDTLVLHIASWAPWNVPDFTAMTAPERELLHVIDLRLTFRGRSRPPRFVVLVEWLRLFGSLQRVMMFDSPKPEPLCVLLRKEFPNIAFTAFFSKEGLNPGQAP
ncbi:hypothetical protein MSAN_00463600 [Mycena sanguinolenta]|uniref:F-box domain-containing protein n=1 Tax=Mycena sanguinolenta TaxID=230812 RepID=A0A8H6ZHN8_9AGAR|nr:hypothetical protein MSAN_00463600 [Mycena sanguinolenta]